ncbi:Gfo/Idh/MocA family oxidoreductase [Pseudomonas sp. H9]|uniref:Gfo/Idh/MocA family oxidoreductase n=1 Tax=Pseudomonas sp. H9 TaxID=483968 RepID=UPI0010579126|nr:Gfo/Idh/MocA family oxidoreductase [Pseudomonas sp. H9]TDF81195.1 hypothetical protein E1573_18420 [Pseudomonas sp. H9]
MNQSKREKSNYLLVGAGQLGTRHLQALVGNARRSTAIQIVDPIQSSLDLARERAESVEDSSSNVELSYFQEIEHVWPIIDFAVIATNANCRLEVIQRLLTKSSVKYLLLEKILFQSADQLDQALELIAKFEIGAYVNCPRRMFPIYQELYDYLKGSKRLVLTVEGDDWGLACNAIHFIDLWSYLTGCIDYDIDLSALNTKVIDSKRSGYKEITGTLRGNAAEHSFHLTSRALEAEEKKPLTVRIETESLVINILESQGVCRILDSTGQVEMEKRFSVLYQSQLTHLVADSLLQHGHCELTSFEDSVALHRPLLTALLAFFNEHDDVVRDHCPIT